jgi:hypothetical protein
MNLSHLIVSIDKCDYQVPGIIPVHYTVCTFPIKVSLHAQDVTIPLSPCPSIRCECD